MTLQLTCSACPSNLSYNDRLNGDCAQCKFYTLILSNLYLPAVETKGSYVDRNESCAALKAFMEFKVGLKVQQDKQVIYYIDDIYSFDYDVYKRLESEFPMIKFEFRGSCRPDYVTIYSRVIGKLFNICVDGVAVNFGDVASGVYSIDCVDNLYAYNYSTDIDHNLVARTMARCGVKLLLGVKKIVSLSGDGFVDFDIHVGERPYHYRIIQCNNDNVVYAYFANEKHHPITVSSIDADITVVDSLDVSSVAPVIDDIVTSVRKIDINDVIDDDYYGAAGDMPPSYQQSVIVQSATVVSGNDRIDGQFQMKISGGLSPPTSMVIVNNRFDDKKHMFIDSHEAIKLKYPLVSYKPNERVGRVKIIYIPDRFNDFPAMQFIDSDDYIKYIDKSGYMDPNRLIVVGVLYYTDDISLIEYVVSNSHDCEFKFIGTYALKNRMDLNIEIVKGYGGLTMCKSNTTRKNIIDNLVLPNRGTDRFYIGSVRSPAVVNDTVDMMPVNDRGDHDHYCYRKLYVKWDNDISDDKYFTAAMYRKAVDCGYSFEVNKLFSFEKISSGVYHIDYGDTYTSLQIMTIVRFMLF